MAGETIAERPVVSLVLFAVSPCEPLLTFASFIFFFTPLSMIIQLEGKKEKKQEKR